MNRLYLMSGSCLGIASHARAAFGGPANGRGYAAIAEVFFVPFVTFVAKPSLCSLRGSDIVPSRTFSCDSVWSQTRENTHLC